MGINLAKGQKISLDKEAGKALSKIVMGLGWDAKKTKGFLGFGGSAPEIDLDASCVLFDEQKNQVDVVFFRQLKSKDGSITHTGDNRTGDGDGDDEQIIVDLAQVPATVKTLMFTVNSFTSVTFNEIENAFCRVFDPTNNQEIAKYNLTCGGPHTAMVMAKLYRHQGEWKMHAIGENATGRTFQDLMPAMSAHL
jgi:tellurium resistance protein TerZ